MSAAAFYDSLARGHFPETAIQAVRIASHDEAFASPSVDGGFRDVESLRYLSGREQTVAAQSFVAAGKFVCGANEGDFLQVEGLVFPSPKTALVEDLGDFTITVLIEKPVDFVDQFQLELSDLSDGQRPIERQSAGGSARQAHVGGNRLGFDQGNVGDQQAQDPFALTNIDARIGPYPWELLREFQDLSAHFCVESVSFLMTSSLVILDDTFVQPQLLVPIGFEGLRDKAVIWIDLHVPPPGEFRLVARSLDVLAAHGVCFRGSGFDLALDRKANLQRHRRHEFDQQRADCRIDDLAGNGLADLSALAGHGLLANIGWD